MSTLTLGRLLPATTINRDKKVPLSQTGVVYTHTGSHSTPKLPLRSHRWEVQEHQAGPTSGL